MNQLVSELIGALSVLLMLTYGYFAAFKTDKLIEYYKRNVNAWRKKTLEKKSVYYQTKFIGIIMILLAFLVFYAVIHASINSK